ncbi:MAG: hypothetical protein EOP56_09315 [Sphingobacteriales bacterium]|nr:MAG: hypothetical protein EOP56_09315 [Sphingobacteriales bacterium]
MTEQQIKEAAEKWWITLNTFEIATYEELSVDAWQACANFILSQPVSGTIITTEKLEKMDEEIDEILEHETPESLTEWLDKRREAYDFLSKPVPDTGIKEEVEKIFDKFAPKGDKIELLTALIKAHGIQQCNKAIDDAAEKVSPEIEIGRIIQQSILTLKK